MVCLCVSVCVIGVSVVCLCVVWVYMHSIGWTHSVHRGLCVPSMCVRACVCPGMCESVHAWALCVCMCAQRLHV